MRGCPRGRQFWSFPSENRAQDRPCPLTPLERASELWTVPPTLHFLCSGVPSSGAPSRCPGRGRQLPMASRAGGGEGTHENLQVRSKVNHLRRGCWGRARHGIVARWPRSRGLGAAVGREAAILPAQAWRKLGKVRSGPACSRRLRSPSIAAARPSGSWIPGSFHGGSPRPRAGRGRILGGTGRESGGFSDRCHCLLWCSHGVPGM